MARRPPADPLTRLASLGTLSQGAARLLEHAAAMRAWQAVRPLRTRHRVPAEIAFALRLLGGEAGEAPFTLRLVAERAGLSERSVRAALRRLEAEDWIQPAGRSVDRRERPFRCTRRLVQLFAEFDALMMALQGRDLPPGQG